MATHIVGLMGKKRSGKDTFAQQLVDFHGFTRLAFADALKDVVLELDPHVGVEDYRLSDIVDEVGWEDAKAEAEVRRLLQRLGVAVRNHVNQSTWVNVVMNKAAYVPGPVVITDVRFPNEADVIERAHGSLVRVVKLGQVSTDTHASETALDDRSAALTVAAKPGDLAHLRREAAFLAGALGARGMLVTS